MTSLNTQDGNNFNFSPEMLFFLYRAGEELASSLDHKNTFEKIEKLVVPHLADYFTIDIINDKNELVPLVMAHHDEKKVVASIEMRKKYPYKLDGPSFTAKVATTGKSIIQKSISSEHIEKIAYDKEHLTYLQEIGYTCGIVVPLQTRGKILGTITFVGTKESDRKYSDGDLILAEEFARKIALTLDNVRLYQEAQQEIAERKKIQAELEKSKHRLQIITNAVPALITYVGSDLRYKFLNDNYKKWLGTKPEKLLGQSLKSTLGETGYKQMKLHIATAFAGNPVQFETKIKDAEGNIRFLNAQYTPDIDENGKVNGIVGLVTDITENKKTLLVHQENETLLELSQEIADLACFEWNLVTNATKWSDNFDTIWGFKSGTFKGDINELFSRVNKTDRERFNSEIESAKQTGKFECEFRTSGDKELIWIHAKGKVFFDTGKPLKLVGIFTNVTESKDSELRVQNLLKEVQHRQVLLDDIIKTVPGIVWELKTKRSEERLELSFLSGFVEKVLGYSVKELSETQNLWKKIIHPDDKSKVVSELFKSISTTSDGNCFYRCYTKAKELIWMESNFVPVINSEGLMCGLRGVNIDITGLKELEQKKDEFIGMASHELKTPLTTIKAYLQLLDRTIIEDARTHCWPFLNKINITVDKLNNLITDLLDVSKINAGKLEYNFEEFNFSELMEEAIDGVQTISPTHKIIVEGKVQTKLTADRQRIEQVLINLLNNAIKYSPEADKVIVKLNRLKDNIHIAIQDFGIGIPQDRVDKVFERFYRVEKHASKFKGLGIGLYITKEIINRHEGKIWIESELGKGSTFNFSLPIK